MDYRVGKHSVFGVLPFFQKPSLQGLLLLSLPFGGFEPFFTGRFVIIHSHGLDDCTKALLGLA